MSKEEIKINEKVKFWEEQDRINKSLIPRVLKMHEMIEGLSKTINSYSTAFGTLEAKLRKSFKEETKSITDFHDSLSKLSDELLDLSEKNKKRLDSINNEKNEIDTKLEDFLVSQESELNSILDAQVKFVFDNLKSI